MIYNVAIIGAGASGLTAAIAAAQKTNNVVLLEKQQRVGKKILLTGNGRCNLTNTEISPENYHFGDDLLFDIMKDFDACEFFKSLGVMCKSDTQGRVYPHSNTAASVLDALRIKCAECGVEEICDFLASDIKKEKNCYVIKSENGEIKSKAVVISTGGYQSDGSAHKIAKALGHKVLQLCPVLCPVETSEAVIKSLKGLRVGARATLLCNGKAVKAECGEVQFAQDALSGICVFNLSRLMKNNNDSYEISLDIAQEYSKKELVDILHNIRNQRKNALCEDFLSGLFAKRIGQCLLKDITKAKACKDITDAELEKIACKIKDWRFAVKKPKSFKGAQVTCGGVDCNQVKNTLESKLAHNVYFCGEVLDVDGDCGGYNLNWAWASGYCAGKNAAEKLWSN